MRKLLAATLIFLSSLSWADALIQEDGSVFLGRVTSVTGESVTVNSFGIDQVIPTRSIAENHKSLAPLKTRRVSIRLKDQAEIEGTIDDYDDEIGLLLNIGFGSITIPVASISGISDPAMAKRHSGTPRKLGLGISGYQVFGGLADDYAMSFSVSAFAEFMVPALRGFFLGGDLTYRNMQYEADSDMYYTQFALKPYLMYSFLDFKKFTGAFERLTPFVALYCGPAYTTLKDDRPFVKEDQKAELNLEAKASLGMDIQITDRFSLRMSGGYSMIFQKSKSFNSADAGLALSYGF